jgi:hypothetical protein
MDYSGFGTRDRTIGSRFGGDILPDYTKSVHQVYADFAKLLVQSRMADELFQSVQHGENMDDVTCFERARSWVPQWENKQRMGYVQSIGLVTSVWNIIEKETSYSRMSFKGDLGLSVRTSRIPSKADTLRARGSF